MATRIRLVVYTLGIPGVLIGVLPWQVLRLEAAIANPLRTLLAYSGALLGLGGVLLIVSGAYYLVRRGDGTPFPFTPPQRMVVAGPYAYIQHPIFLGLLAIAFGEALWFQSVGLSIYALLLTLLANLYIIHIEEPTLEKRFGDDYRAYRAATPRWLPFGQRGT